MQSHALSNTCRKLFQKYGYVPTWINDDKHTVILEKNLAMRAFSEIARRAAMLENQIVIQRRRSIFT
jgi:hypothetical protein